MAERLTKIYPVRLTPSTWRRLTKLAEQQGRPVSALAREALTRLVSGSAGSREGGRDGGEGADGGAAGDGRGRRS